MAFNYVPTFADYRTAHRLCVRHRADLRARYFGYVIGLPVATAVFAALTIHEAKYRGDEGFGLLAAMTFVFLLLTIVIVALMPWRLRRSFRRSRGGVGTNAVSRFSFDDEGVTFAVKDHSETRLFWKAILDVAENEEVVLLYTGKTRFFYVPKRALTEHEWSAFHEMARRKEVG